MGHLRIVRRGTAQTVKTAKNQCGHIGHITYKYEVKVTIKEGDLDDDGYIIENSKIARTVDEVFRSYVSSCENYALAIGEAIMKDFTKVKIVDIYVKVRPTVRMGDKPKAYMEYSLTGKF